MSTASTENGGELFISNPHSTDVRVSIWSQVTGTQTITVTCHTVGTVYLSSNVRADADELKESKGILITSTKDVVVSGSNAESESYDSFMALPTDVLGTNYSAVTFVPSVQACQVLVVGVNNDTDVSVTLGSALGDAKVTYGTVEYAAGSTINVSLNRFEMFQLQSSGDLSGTRIISNHDVAVFSGNINTYVGSKTHLGSHLVEQLTPVKTWGRTFILAPIPYTYVSVFFLFLASEDGTTIQVTGDFESMNYDVDAGDTIQIEFPYSRIGHLVANKPISVFEYSQGYTDLFSSKNPTMILIPPIEQFATTYTFGTPSNSVSNYFVFMIKKEDYEGLKYDGGNFPLSSVYLKTMPESEFVTGSIFISTGSHIVRHSSPYVTFGGFLYGSAQGYKTYGIPIGMRMVAINSLCLKSDSDIGDGKDNDCDGRIDEEFCPVGGNVSDIDGDGHFNEDCVGIPEVDGQWSAWSNYTTCSRSCFDGWTYGTKSRYRRCTNPAPATCDGKWCKGDVFETAPCPEDFRCPIDGGWTDWSGWSACSVTCSVDGSEVTDVKVRSRRCTNPSPQYNGEPCSGSTSEQLSCLQKSLCPAEVASTTNIQADTVSNTEISTNYVSTTTTTSEDVSTTTEATGDMSTTTVAPGDVSTTTVPPGDVSTTTIAADDMSSTSVATGDMSTTTVAPGDVSTTSVATGVVSTTTVATGDMSTTTVASGDMSTTTVVADDVSTTTIANGDVSTTLVAVYGIPSTNSVSEDISTGYINTNGLSAAVPIIDSSQTPMTSFLDSDDVSASFHTHLFTSFSNSLSSTTATMTSGLVQQLLTTSVYSPMNLITNTQQTSPVIPSDSNISAVTDVSNQSHSTASTSVFCGCNWYSCDKPGIDELRKMVEELKSKLQIFRNQTSRYKRSLTSAEDIRVSAQATGYAGSIILVGLGIFLIVVDRRNLLDMITVMKRNICCR
ncbi:uncharacterized protein LOC117336084 [Pecten maximus]|uniref:uncharacterized protein LOC117336084 n=1 Tax=Pecten maximus TaxID=6579 RepID=UPI001458D13B|nr:uncharacterized protein LOC117336084 [Pecten maximus]